MNRRILIPTDFSRNALNAARYAMDLYRDYSCDFFLFNVYQRQFSTAGAALQEDGSVTYEAAREASEDQLERSVQLLALHGENPRHNIRTLQQFNSIVDGIRDVVSKKDIDLIVMGSKGVTDAETRLFGTNTVKVMEEVGEVPVLAIPSDYSYRTPKEIVFPTDYKTSYKRKHLFPLIDIARKHGAVIRVLHIRNKAELTRTQQDNKALLGEQLAPVLHQFHEILDVPVKAGICAFIESRESDMIAFINRKHNFFGSILSQPLVKRVGYQMERPVLVLHGDE